MLRIVSRLWMAFLLAASFGCSERPRAPALTTEAIYRNAREGFRFVVPPGWSQQAKIDLPAGKNEKLRLLVRYERILGDKAAVLEVTTIDLPVGTDVQAYLQKPAYGSDRWKPLGKPIAIQCGEQPATKYQFTYRSPTEENLREVIAVKRGERLYFFTGIFAIKDKFARQEFHRTVDGIIWKA